VFFAQVSAFSSDHRILLWTAFSFSADKCHCVIVRARGLTDSMPSPVIIDTSRIRYANVGPGLGRILQPIADRQVHRLPCLRTTSLSTADLAPGKGRNAILVAARDQVDVEGMGAIRGNQFAKGLVSLFDGRLLGDPAEAFSQPKDYRVGRERGQVGCENRRFRAELLRRRYYRCCNRTVQGQA
jgi:hypothetical protein